MNFFKSNIQKEKTQLTSPSVMQTAPESWKYNDASIVDLTELVHSFTKQTCPRLWRNEITGMFHQNSKTITDTSKLYRKFIAQYPELRDRINRHSFHTILENLTAINHNPLRSFFRKQFYNRGGGSNTSKFVRCLKLKKLDGYSIEATYEKVQKIFVNWLDNGVASVFDSQINRIVPVLVAPPKCKAADLIINMVPTEIRNSIAKTDPQTGASQLCEKFLLLTDFAGMNQQEMNMFQGFVSVDSFSYVSTTGVLHQNKKRLASLCGIAEHNQFGTTAHSAQIHPIEITGIDWKLFDAVDKEALFLEAYKRYTTPPVKLSNLL
jgi:hypothetical protein